MIEINNLFTQQLFNLYIFKSNERKPRIAYKYILYNLKNGGEEKQISDKLKICYTFGLYGGVVRGGVLKACDGRRENCKLLKFFGTRV